MNDPEIGIVATLYDLDGRQLLGQFTAEGWWFGENNFIGHDCVEKWQPITTPEERRLRAEVERLREFRKLAELAILHGSHLDASKALAWLRNKETEAGGAVLEE